MTAGRLIFFAFCLSLLALSCTTPDLSDPAIQEAINMARNLGLAHLEENQLSDAEQEFRKLLELNPSDPSGHANLGIVYLRRGELDQAEESLSEALALAPEDPHIYLNLSEVYEQSGEIEKARQLIDSALETDSTNVQTLYRRAELYREEEALRESYTSYLKAVVQYAPANIVPRFHLVESMAQTENLAEALTQLMDLRQQISELPREAQPHFDAAVTAMQAGDAGVSFRSSRIFHNLMKVTPYYQTSLRLLGLRTDAAAGTPVISDPVTIVRSTISGETESDFIIDSMEFTDASENAGFVHSSAASTASTLIDFNSDGEVDVFLSEWDEQQNINTFFLYQSQFGRFSDVAETAGIVPASTKTHLALAADINNDTFLDLYLINEGPDQLFQNKGDGTFEEVNARAQLEASDVTAAVFSDIDHDGDLDLFAGRNGQDVVFRNNADGTFVEITAEKGLAGTSTSVTNDIDFGDFDDDGDLDFIVSGSEGLSLYTNREQATFEPLAAQPFASLAGVNTTAVGDYNNDGFLDLFTHSAAGFHFYVNQGTGEFAIDENAVTTDNLTRTLTNGQVEDALFFDADNDGFLDLFVAGNPSLLLHNNRSGAFTDVTSQLLPAPDAPHLQVEYSDYNADRDLDLFVRTANGLQLLRNDGGQQNRMVSIQTRGLVNNNSKNNYFNIGARVEVRAGDLYQSQVVTGPVTYFGIGKRIKADVIRIVFTNGVPQNIFRPGTDQDILEQQILKGSCPFLYTWNGEAYTFATDILWRSALGMPLGIMAGDKQAYAPASIARDYIQIPEDALAAKDGRYRIKVTGELWETPYLDEIKLLAVDHPASAEIRIDEKFGPPPSGTLPIYTLNKKDPVNAVDHQGRDVSTELSQSDQEFVALTGSTRYQGLMEMHDLVLKPATTIDPDKAVLYLKGWVFPTDASINVAVSQTETFHPIPPRIQVRDKNGVWVTVIENAGFPMGKNKTVRVDLAGKFLSDHREVRIQTNMQIYWDHAFFAEEDESAPIQRTVLSPASADLHYRGFSRMYRSSPFGPHLFDHDSVSTTPRWLDLTGKYTRYGNVSPLLQNTDDQYVIMNAGDAIEIDFEVSDAPALTEGWERSFILYTNGWLKDGDLNTAFGKTVDPLPFLGMSQYPYGKDEGYPMTPENIAYLEKYNTRVVGRDGFREWMKSSVDFANAGKVSSNIE